MGASAWAGFGIRRDTPTFSSRRQEGNHAWSAVCKEGSGTGLFATSQTNLRWGTPPGYIGAVAYQSSFLSARSGRRRGGLLPLLALSGLLMMHGVLTMPGMPALAATPRHTMPMETGHGEHQPPAHMTSPCVSDAARPPTASPASPPSTMPSTHGAAVYRWMDQRPAEDIGRAPPDLTRLCIART